MSELHDFDHEEMKSDVEAMARHRRRIAHSRTPEEHMKIVEKLQRESMDAIFSDPVALEAFMARNHRKRRAQAVEQLEAKLMGRQYQPGQRG